MTRRGFLPTLALAAAALLLAGCQSEPEGPREAPPLVGADLDGQLRDISDHAGDVIVVNTWASWCAPCRDEMPVLAAAQESLQDEGFQVMGINVRDRPESAARLVEETGVPFPSIVDPDGTLAVEWGVLGMPQTFVVDRQGHIVDHVFGAVDQAWVESTVEPLVRGVPEAEEDRP
ncbi:TlpA family protein disulfide reductase [Nesterenkonia lutea]|uniref:Cytochrome c biogenesis protein CcmG/thiol:disulfide interchange protein DsbE n=1 Tax=Nesterenkonia lutea TaxID=272919 RepID=A0ABR9JCE1_9MICC|nr:TlpA disulfide reductase family protein [Nesterenkonia lutea]MBE1523455.1 cytochrome c biogenesis protein CcmG/thiol:disulfide interchange protein DsbE [Nesterenkonia lutea]